MIIIETIIDELKATHPYLGHSIRRNGKLVYVKNKNSNNSTIITCLNSTIIIWRTRAATIEPSERIFELNDPEFYDKLTTTLAEWWFSRV